MFRLAVLCMCLLSVASATPVNKCDGKPFPSQVRIKDCNQPPCAVVKGTTANFQVDFEAAFPIKIMTTKVRATVLGLTVNYPLDDEQANTCAHLLYGSYCPLDRGEDITYNFDFPVGNSYPEIGVNVEVSLEDESKKVVTCFNVDIKVKSH